MASFQLTYFSYCRECLSHERQRLEENSERRLEIFKELVNGYTKYTDEENKLKDQACSEPAGTLVYLFAPNNIPFTNCLMLW